MSALSELDSMAYAATSHGPRQMRSDLWSKLMLAQGLDPHNLTVKMLRTGAAILRKAGYRSAWNIVDQAVNTFRERGGTVDQPMTRHLYIIKRAFEGIGRA